jgi:hypothetical protein
MACASATRSRCRKRNCKRPPRGEMMRASPAMPGLFVSGPGAGESRRVSRAVAVSLRRPYRAMQAGPFNEATAWESGDRLPDLQRGAVLDADRALQRWLAVAVPAQDAALRCRSVFRKFPEAATERRPDSRCKSRWFAGKALGTDGASWSRGTLAVMFAEHPLCCASSGNRTSGHLRLSPASPDEPIVNTWSGHACAGGSRMHDFREPGFAARPGQTSVAKACASPYQCTADSAHAVVQGGVVRWHGLWGHARVQVRARYARCVPGGGRGRGPRLIRRSSAPCPGAARCARTARSSPAGSAR